MINQKKYQTDLMLTLAIQTTSGSKDQIATTMRRLSGLTAADKLTVPFRVYALESKCRILNANACDSCPMAITNTSNQKGMIERCKKILVKWINEVKSAAKETKEAPIKKKSITLMSV